MKNMIVSPWQSAVDYYGKEYFFKTVGTKQEPHMADTVAKVMSGEPASVRFRVYNADYRFGDWANWGKQPDITDVVIAKAWCDDVLKLLGYTLT